MCGKMKGIGLFLGLLCVCLWTGFVWSAEEVKTETVASQLCWMFQNDTVRLAVTQTGAHMAPVIFGLDSDRTIQPYYVSPWQNEGLKLDPPVLISLRGDFFCLPFGGTANRMRGCGFAARRTGGRPMDTGGIEKDRLRVPSWPSPCKLRLRREKSPRNSTWWMGKTWCTVRNGSKGIRSRPRSVTMPFSLSPKKKVRSALPQASSSSA